MARLASKFGILAFMVLVGVACQAKTSPEHLTMLTSPDYCPYEFVIQSENGKSELVGFDIDVAKAIADDLGVFLTIETRHFNQILPALERQQADFAMAAITPTRGRQKMANFSNIYYAQTMAIVSRGDQPFTTLNSLINKTVGIRAASFHAQELARYSDIHQITFSSSDVLITAVKTRQVDAIILDQAIAPKYVTPASQLIWTPVKMTEATDGVAIAFPKLLSVELQTAVDDALVNLQQNGTMTALIHEWFDGYQCL
ncbi:MAG: ABC transporter substrate-binding protein [Cyanobacteria bacterium P01_F01_bin.150]